jgi:8-oxo-dGTP diphosphatase
MGKSVSKLLQNTKTVQKIIIERNGKILMVRRGLEDKSFAGWWDLPGGGAHKEEELVKSITREVMEETRLKVLPAQVRAFFIRIFDNKHVLIGYTTGSFKGRVRLSSEHLEYRWASLSESLGLKVQPTVRRLLKAYSKL